MSDRYKFIIQDSYGNKLNAELIMRFKINDVNEYILYNLEKDDSKFSVYVAKVLYNQKGEEIFVGINERFEEENIFSIVDGLINKVR